MSHSKHFHSPFLSRIVELLEEGKLYHEHDVPRFVQMPNGNIADTYLNCHLTDCDKQSGAELRETARLVRAIPWERATDYRDPRFSVKAMDHRYYHALEQLKAA